jgi:hypothetical protein
MTPQAAFLRWMRETASVSADTAVTLWCQVNAFIDRTPALARLQVDTATPGGLDRSFTAAERGIAPYASDLVGPVFGALLTSVLLPALGFGAVVTAVVTLVVFCVLLFRKDGALDRIKAWMDSRLAPLKAFAL